MSISRRGILKGFAAAAAVSAAGVPIIFAARSLSPEDFAMRVLEPAVTSMKQAIADDIFTNQKVTHRCFGDGPDFLAQMPVPTDGRQMYDMRQDRILV